MLNRNCLYQLVVFIVFNCLMVKMGLPLTPEEDWYDVQPHSIYYPSEPADVIYFDGSTIEFTCDVFCQRNCQTRLLYNNSNGSFLLLRGNIFDAPLKFELNYFGHSKVTLRITNATASSAGSYQCLTEAWKNTYIVNKEATFRMAVLGPTNEEIKFVSKGDSIFLQCIINASKNIYPQPDRIEWWSNNIQCDPSGCENDSFITQDGGLLLTNVTTNGSYRCVVYWSNKTHNGSQYHIVINQSVGSHHASVYPKTLKAKVGEDVQFVCSVSGFGKNYSIKWYHDNSSDALQTINYSHVLSIPAVKLNDSGNYYCAVSNGSQVNYRTVGFLKVLEPPHISDIDDVLVDINGQGGVSLNCSFTGHPMPTVYWIKVLKKKQFPSYRPNLNSSTVFNGSTAILNVLPNAVEDLGSYQCIAKNEAGYFSRTARVLPKGWTNGVGNLNIEFIDDENYTIKVSWKPPDYDGGIPVHYYKLILYDLYDPSEKILDDSFNATVYLWDDLEQHNHSGRFQIIFGVIVSDLQKTNRSVIAKTDILTEFYLPIRLQVTLKVDCENTNVSTEWELKHRHSNDDINGYCLDYKCITIPQQQKCSLNEIMSHRSIPGVPVDTTCWFALTVKSRVDIVSNNVSCYRNKSVTLSSAYSSISPTPSFMTSSPSKSSFLETTLSVPDASPSLIQSSTVVLSMSLSTFNRSPSLSSSPSKSPFLETTLSTPDASPLLIQSSTVLSMSLSTFNTSPSSVIYHSSMQSPPNSFYFILLLVAITLLILLGILTAVFVMRKRNNRNKLTHEQLNHLNEVNKAFSPSDFDDDLKDAISDTEIIIIDDDELSLFDAMQYCDTEKMYKRIINSNSFDSALSLQSIESNIDFNSCNDSGEAASSRGCASHYYNPNGVENFNTQTYQCDSGNSIVDSRECASHYYNPNGVENSSIQTHQYDSGNFIVDT